MTHLSPLTDVPLQTPSYTNTLTQGLRHNNRMQSSSDVTPALVSGNINRHYEPHSHLHSDQKKSVCGNFIREEFSSSVAFRWQRLCVCLRVHLCGCMCVFVGLSGEPGQSVRCGNGGFKDKRCGEFPGCLFPTPSSPLPSSLSSPIPSQRQAGTQVDTWMDKERMQGER